MSEPADGLAAVPDGLPPLLDGPAPVPNGLAPVLGGVSPVLDERAPVPDERPPALGGPAPVPDELAPVPAGLSPLLGGLAPVHDRLALVLDDCAPLLGGLPPVLDADTRLVVLGSFPGVASLRAQQYYGHPRNHFWPILSALWNLDLVSAPYPRRLEAVHAHGLGLWDVYASCRRDGSLDSAIEDAQLNDLASLRRLAPRLAGIAHNGGESARAMKHTLALGLPVARLPSTSPANASWSFARKLAAWRAVFEQHGLA